VDLLAACVPLSPTTDYVFRSRHRGTPGPQSPDYPVPPRKSLFGKDNARGLPIGNLTSQFWANVYLNELDQFVKRELHCRHYLRYVDDLVLLAHDPAPLAQWCDAIREFLREHLKLSVRPEMTTPFPVQRGVDFVGWKTWWDHRLPRRRTLGNLATRLDSFERGTVRRAAGGAAQRINLRCRDGHSHGDRLRSMLSSYAGHLQHGAAMGAWEALWARHRWLPALFERRAWSLAARWSSQGLLRAPGFPAQYRRLTSRAGSDALVFLQVGRFVEFCGPQRLAAARALGLRSVALGRASYAFRAGFPACLSGRYVAKAIGQGLTVVEVPQVPARVHDGCARRLPCAVWIPSPK
jgi:hypothetical protein